MPSLRQVAVECLLLPGVFAQACSLLGQVYPQPRSLLSSEVFAAGKAALFQALSDGVKTGQTDYGPLDSVNTTFSIGVFSAHDPGHLFEFHHQATGASAPKIQPGLNGDSIYRVASVTKVLTVLTMLARLGGRVPWDDPITKYVAELRNAPVGDVVGRVQWQDVTLGALASHLGGVARDCADVPSRFEGCSVLTDRARCPPGCFGRPKRPAAPARLSRSQ